MKKQILIAVISASVVFFSCQKQIDKPVQQEEFSTIANNNSESKRVYITNVDQLYAEINNPENAGRIIVLAPGLYMLNANHPNGGRLELLHDMSLGGQPGNPEAVIIDASNLPASSRAVRMGNGKNSLEWLTLQNDPAHSLRSLVQTDIVATPVAQIRIAHNVIKGSSIGINIINGSATANGRIIEAEIEDNEIMDNTVPNFGAGIQIQNSSGVNGASIYVTMRRNYIHGNRSGIFGFNATTQDCIIEVKSFNDNIEGNGIGLTLNGGFIQNGPSLNNLLKFDAYAISVKNNTGNPSPPWLYPACGVHVAGAESFHHLACPGWRIIIHLILVFMVA